MIDSFHKLDYEAQRAWDALERLDALFDLDWTKGYNPDQPRDMHGKFLPSPHTAARSEQKAKHAEARKALRGAHKSAREALKAKHAAERAGVTGKAARSELAAKHAAERAELRGAHATERTTLAEAHQGEREALKASQTAPTAADALKGHTPEAAMTRAYGADPRTSYPMAHKLVDMDDVHASNLQNGAINPEYDPSLQPRDRSRAASLAQIDTVARTMNPDVLLTDFHRIDSGTPIVDEAGNVLSGNGRTLAMQRAAEFHPDVYDDYKTQLKARAAELGLDPAAIDGMKRPMLVRELQGEIDTAAFAREANSSGTLRMSPLEQAKVDAGQLEDRSLSNLHVDEGQDIDRALRSKDNKPFVDSFMETVPDNERAALLTRDGSLNQMGLYRAKAALYSKAFPGESGERMAESMLESLDPDVKQIQNGISGALPSIAKTSGMIGSGLRDPELDIMPDVAKSIDTLARIRDNPHLTAGTPANQLVDKYLGQSNMFGRELNADQEALLRHFDQISRKPTEVKAFFHRYAQAVEQQPQPGQGNMFGDATGMTRSQLIQYLIGGQGGGSAPAQAGMFG